MIDFKIVLTFTVLDSRHLCGEYNSNGCYVEGPKKCNPQSTFYTKLNHNYGMLCIVKPHAYSQYCHLECLNLKNNKLTSISSSAFRGTKLRDLNLRNNSLRGTPNLVSIASTLEILDISHNTLGWCEKDVKYNISFSALDTLFMGHNELTLLPNIALKAANLSELYIENNKFFTLPDLTVGFPSLKTLVISGNSLLCNCSIVWLKVQERRDDVTVTSHGITCSKYGPYHGQSLGRVSLEQLMDQCDRSQQIECK